MYKIAIRAGHGAGDPGAVNGAFQEKTIALQTAKALNLELQKQGFETPLVRREDEAVKIADGCRAANRWGANFYLSIHCNASAPSAKGAEIYYRTKAEKGFAADILNCYLNGFGFINRGVKYSENLGDLNYTNMPACLIELGFLSNSGDLSILTGADYPQRAGKAICKGICNAFGLAYHEEEKPMTKEEEINNLVWQMGHRGILTETEKWLDKLRRDEDLYWLLKKIYAYMQNKDV